MLKSIPGTKDILPQESWRWQETETIARKIFSLYNYQEIRTPILEDASLFNRSLGENTEIVQKQMFLINPAPARRSGVKNESDTYALRPEGTASVIRSYLENNLDKTLGLAKLYYIGPMFRKERPQKGRLRQFHHIGCEAIGSNDPSIDLEIISLADTLLKTLKIEGYTIKINSLGCAKDRKELSAILKDNLKKNLSALCADCQRRFKTNILRILDCKNESCRKIIDKLDIQDAHLCTECKDNFKQVKDGLSALGVNFEVAPHLVRGLDYYTRTVFEITHQALGSQDAIGAGGRYDGLVSELDGPQLGAMGFAFGVERLLLAGSQEPGVRSNNLVYLITLGEAAKKEGLKILSELRKNGIHSDTDYENKSLKGAMRKANDLKARCVLILGDDELKKNTITLKDMASGEQKEIPITALTSTLTSTSRC